MSDTDPEPEPEEETAAADEEASETAADEDAPAAPAEPEMDWRERLARGLPYDEPEAPPTYHGPSDEELAAMEAAGPAPSEDTGVTPEEPAQ